MDFVRGLVYQEVYKIQSLKRKRDWYFVDTSNKNVKHMKVVLIRDAWQLYKCHSKVGLQVTKNLPTWNSHVS